jgi:hypothetical protein
MGVRVSRSFNAWLQDVADQLGISKSELCQRTLEHALDNGSVQNIVGGLDNENE